MREPSQPATGASTSCSSSGRSTTSSTPRTAAAPWARRAASCARAGSCWPPRSLRFAPTIDGLANEAFRDPGFEAVVEADLRRGHHRNPDLTGRPDWFTTAYFHLPDEFAAEVRDAGFALEALVAVEGVGRFLADPAPWLEDLELRSRLMRAIARVESEPSLLGASPHLLAVGRA